MAPQDPEKTVHEDLGLTAAMAFARPIDATSLDELAVDDATSYELPEKVWTWQRVLIASAIAAAAAGELVWALASRDSLAARREAAALLPESEKAALEAKRERFEKLDPTEQSRLRELQAELARDASPETLYATLEEYLKWKSQLAPQESAMLAGLSPNERSARVASVAAQQQTEVSKRFSDADSAKLVHWLENEVRARQARIIETLPEQMRERFENMGDRERPYALIYHVFTTRGGGPRLEEIASDLPKLRAQLSPAAQARWDVAFKNKDEFKSLLSDWIRQSFERGQMHHDGGKQFLAVDDKELRKFFEQVSEEDRQRLLAMPKEEMMTQLRREYFRAKGGWKDGGGKPNGFGRPGFGPMDDGRGGFRRPPDEGHKGPGGERRPPNGDMPPPPPPREGDFKNDGFRDNRREGERREGDREMQGPRGDREKKFPEKKPGVGKENGDDGDKKPTSEKKPDA